MARWIGPDEAVQIGLRLRRARLAQGATLKQVAAACGGDHTRISKIERGRFSSLNSYVQRVCNHVDIDPELPDDLSSQALHARLDRLIRERPGAAAALQAVFNALDRLVS